jgi:hypothetical protein
MALSLNLVTLESRKIQVVIDAKRKVAAIAKAGGLLSKLQKLGGFLWGAIGRFLPPLSFESVWEMLVDGYFEIKQFDWNQMDSEIEKQIEQNNQRLLNSLADSVGNKLGFEAVRLASSFTGKFLKGSGKPQNVKIPVVSGELAIRLAEESDDETVAAVRRFLMLGSKTMVANSFLRTVLYLRRNDIAGFDSITKELGNGSIAAKIEEKIEKLPKWLQQPVENLIEGFEEGVIEAMTVVTTSLDDIVAANRYARRTQDGPYRTIEVKFDKESDEVFEFSGPQLQVVEAINSAIPTQQMLAGKDVGSIVAQSAEESIKPGAQLRQLHILYHSVERKPWTRKGKRAQRAEITIPNAKAGLSWDDLKSRIPKHSYGPHFVTLKLSNGRQMSGWFSSEGEGRRTLESLADLSTEKVVPGSIRSSVAVDDPVPKKRKKLYPTNAALMHPRNKNRLDNKGGEIQRMELWQKVKPKNAETFR